MAPETGLQQRLEDSPVQSWRLLRQVLPAQSQPFLRGARKYWQRMSMQLDEPYRTVFPYTQSHPVRQASLVDLCQRIETGNVAGAIVECGVLDGGTAALMAWATRASAVDRPVHLFDAWQGLPLTTVEDGSRAAEWTGQVVGSPARVAAVMRKLAIAPGRITIHRGWFHETFPHACIDPVALLHVDCDFYAPTRLCLEKWYPVLSPGGYMQFDDYAAFEGCRKAVDEFLRDHPESSLTASGANVQAFFIQKPL